MRLTLVVLEENTGRTVQLTHDNAFAAVDDERSLFRHERDFAHVDVVFADFLDGAGFGGITVKNFELDAGAQCRAVGEPSQLAFSDVKLGLLQLVAEELQTGITVVARDREDGSEGCLQAVILTAFGLDIRLKEFFVAAKLHFQQGGHFKDARTRSKTLPNAFLFSERVRHGDSVRREGEKNTWVQSSIDGKHCLHGLQRRQKPLGQYQVLRPRGWNVRDIFLLFPIIQTLTLS